MFRTGLSKVNGGFKPQSRETVRRWLQNIHLIGWWPVSEESNEVIVNNHEAIINRDDFEQGYMRLTGYTLDGIPLGNFKAKWPTLTLEEKQKLFRLLTKKVEVEPLSPHWLRLTIYWISPVKLRPDVTLIWRQIGAKGALLQDWE
jgi:hypothetical protein